VEDSERLLHRRAAALLDVADRLLSDVGENANRVSPSKEGTISNWLNDVASAHGNVTRSTILESMEKSLGLHPAKPLHPEADSNDHDQRQSLREGWSTRNGLALTRVDGAGPAGFILARSEPLARRWVIRLSPLGSWT